jgi:hypothetical protein
MRHRDREHETLRHQQLLDDDGVPSMYRRSAVPRRRHLHVALALVAAGCVPTTGLMVEVAGPSSTTSTAAGVATLDFVVAHPSWCERWVGDASANHTRVSVAGRDLTKEPYDFLIEASRQTDLSEPVYVSALAYGAGGQLLGEARFDSHPFAKDEVLQRRARIGLFGAAAQPGGPKYVAGDGCVCVPGDPWIGTGTGTGCDPLVITSFARLGDTAGCELTPKGAPLPVPACDGQKYGDEPTNRDLPCWADDGNGVCRMTTRTCVDDGGVAYGAECATGGGDPAMPSGALCARYLGCEQSACGDVLGCFKSAFTAAQQDNVRCTLHLDPTTRPNEPIRPCPGGVWAAPLPVAMPATGTCLSALLEGVDQPPFTLSLTASPTGANGGGPTATMCPTVLQVDAVDAPYPEAVPATTQLDVIVGEHLVHVALDVVLHQCAAEPSLVCTPG